MRRSAPWSSMCVAKLCRSTCGWAPARMPAATPGASHVGLHRAHREAAARAVEEQRPGHPSAARPQQLRPSRSTYASIAARAGSPNSATRMRSPLPVTVTWRFGQVEVAQVDGGQLADAKARPVQQLQHGAGAQALRRIAVGRDDQRRRLVSVQDARQVACRPGRAQPQDRVARFGGWQLPLAVQPGVEAADHAAVALHRAVGDVAPAQQREELAPMTAARAVERDIALREEGEEGGQVVAIVAQRVRRATLHPFEVVEVALQRRARAGAGGGCLRPASGARCGHGRRNPTPPFEVVCFIYASTADAANGCERRRSGARVC